jgi:hypothetical protein
MNQTPVGVWLFGSICEFSLYRAIAVIADNRVCDAGNEPDECNKSDGVVQLFAEKPHPSRGAQPIHDEVNSCG